MSRFRSPYASYYENLAKRDASERVKGTSVKREVKQKASNVTHEPDAEETVLTGAYTGQTYPSKKQPVIIRQSANQLTCGMQALQNLYGLHFVTRKEMDAKAAALQDKAFGVKMYDEKLGYYNMEVLKSLLVEKGKHIQRIEHIHIPSNYFHPIVSLNAQFSGYLVALEHLSINHYVTIRCNSNGIRLYDSMRERPITILPSELFQSNATGKIFCCPEETRPVIAILAVGGSPFVGYTLLHDTWSEEPRPSASAYSDFLLSVLDGEANSNWKRHNKTPEKNIYAGLKQNLLQKLNPVSASPRVIVKFKDRQVVVEAKSVDQLLIRLQEMNWIAPTVPFRLEQDGKLRINSLQSRGTFEDYSIDPQKAIELRHDEYHPSQVSIGGFYSFDCHISGEIKNEQQDLYSVQDGDGLVHVVYKKTIQNIEELN